MSDPFSVEHADWLPGSAGRTSGFFAGVGAGYDQQYNVDSAYALEDEVYERWQKSLAGLERVTGQKFDMPLDYSSINNYVRAARGEDPSFWAQAFTFQGLDASEAIKAREPFIKANDAIKQLNDPNITSMEDIINEVIKKRAEVSGRSAQVSETGGFGAMVGQFVGAIGGSFSERDPLLLGTLGFGGFGKTAAARLATEMAAVGGVEAVQQYAAVEPTRDLLGEEEGSPLLNVLFAAAGGGLLRGGVEGAAKFLESRRTQPNVLELTDDMRVAFEAQPQSPTARAGIHLLDMADEFDRANPYAGSEAGTRRFIAELAEVQKVASGQPETAIARFLPATTVDTQKLDADSLIVQAERPAIYDALIRAQNQLAEIDEQIVSLTLAANRQPIRFVPTEMSATRLNEETFFHGTNQEFDNFEIRGPRDGISLTNDRESAEWYAQNRAKKLGGTPRVIEVRVNTKKPLTVLETNDYQSYAKTAKAKGYDVVVGPIHEGPSPLINLTILDPSQIRRVQGLGDLRRSRKTAAKEFRAARKQFDSTLADIQAAARIRERIQHLRTVGDLGAQAKLMDEIPGEALRHDNVEAAVETTTRAAETIDDAAEAIVRAAEVEDGIDLGNGVVIPKDFTFNIEDEAGNPVAMSAEALARDLKDDISLDEAVKTCSTKGTFE